MSFDIYTNDLIEDAEKSLSESFLEIDKIMYKNNYNKTINQKRR